MVKQLFNNPWFIAALGALAVGYFCFSVIWPMVFEDETPQDGLGAFANEVVDDFDGDIGGPAQTLSKPDEDQIMWLTDLNRDPFTPALNNRPKGNAVPRVSALFVGGGIASAIIDKQLVRVGDAIADFRVAAIDADSVTLIRDGHAYVLEPEV